ncbi:MAG: S9 family peptidase [Steroidobacteraceae bacterium]
MRRVGVLFLFGLACSLNAGAAEPIPLQAFAREPLMRAPVLSPSGKQLVYVGANERNEPGVVVYNFATREVRPLITARIKSFDIAYCAFKTEERLLCGYWGTDFDGGRPHSVTRLVGVDTSGRNTRLLMQRGRSGDSQFQHRVLHWLPDDPQNVLIQVAEEHEILPTVFMLNVFTSKMQPVVPRRTPILTWMADRRGQVRLGYGGRSSRMQYIARDTVGAPWRVLEQPEAFDPRDFIPLGFSADSDHLLVLADYAGRRGIYEMGLSDQADMQLVYSHPVVDVDGLISWTRDGTVVGFSYETDRPTIELIDARAKAIQQLIDKSLPDTYNRVINTSDDGNWVLFSSSSDVKADVFYLLDMKQGTLQRLGVARPALDGAELAPMQPVTITAEDGQALPGYLTSPVGSSGKDLPLVVYPHGGPYSRDSWGFDQVVQVMASRGYAVLQVNFRGSTGYGAAFEDAGKQAWATVMHDDITAAARWAIDQGIADPKRVCIVGWSYGGFAALVASYKEPKLYKCAVSIAGVSDLRALVQQNDRFVGGRAGTLAATGSAAFDDPSPIDMVSEVAVPVLLVHGDADVSVVVDHSEKMAKALASAGKSIELLVIKDGDHSLRRGEWRLALYRKLTEFLAQYLGPT